MTTFTSNKSVIQNYELGVHPYKFLGFIFSNPHLKQHMVSVFDDYFKRSNFSKDLGKTLDLYDLRDKLYCYLDDFANEVNIPKEKIKPYIDDRDWHGLLKLLTFY